jgi:hypothetical protein
MMSFLSATTFDVAEDPDLDLVAEASPRNLYAEDGANVVFVAPTAASPEPVNLSAQIKGH